jgi:hypothetical protein
MLHPARVTSALRERREDLISAAAASQKTLTVYEYALTTAAALSSRDLRERVAFEPWPGALPTTEIDTEGLVLPFQSSWTSAQESRSWALETLRGVPVAAVDGSQIVTSKELRMPVSLLQVAWFINYHDPLRRYVKDVANEIVTESAGSEVSEYAIGNSIVNSRRFCLEMERAVTLVATLPSEPVPLVLIDGTFILSFLRPMQPEDRAPYLDALFNLLDASRQHRVPVAGYVDLSFATDLTSLLRLAFDLAPATGIFDAALLSGQMESFERTAALEPLRHDVMHLYRRPERDYTRDLVFVYLQTGPDRLPSRVDLPRWVLDEGLLDRVLDVLRAEIIVGAGYPYALETADAAAVLTTEDRMTFARQFHEFAEDAEIAGALSSKSRSKFRRR